MTGKYKRTLREKCPECGRLLELREMERDGIAYGHTSKLHDDIIVCSNQACYYEREVRKNGKKKRKSPLE